MQPAFFINGCAANQKNCSLKKIKLNEKNFAAYNNNFFFL